MLAFVRLRPAALTLFVMLSLSGFAQANNQLPDIGTAAVSTLSIEQEQRYGEAFMLLARAQLPVLNDPVLEVYINQLGNRLLSHADSVPFPFHFFLIQDNSVNAAAFLGGYIKVHTGLFLYASDESQLASVLAHEISHETQRHIARYLEDQSKTNAATLAGVIGSLALGIINPAAGVAAMSTTVGLKIQSGINYTRENEYEADRIGMQLLYRAGFDPRGMMQFFEKLKDQSRYSSTPPQYLLTHPLTNTRIAEARARAENYPVRHLKPSLAFQLAKARIEARYSPKSKEQVLSYFDKQLKEKSYKLKDAALYGQALALMRNSKNQQALTILSKLLKASPDNLFYIDAITDADLALKQNKQAIQRLEALNQQLPYNQVIVINLASAYIQSDQADKAITLLERYLRNHQNDVLGWQLMSQAAQQQGDAFHLYLAQGQYLALQASFDDAITNLKMARLKTPSKLEIARIDARIRQLQVEKTNWLQLIKG
ncbi:beta-barrel assembly-enhancing protease [Dongshaea marina]|uniref:beta-barrel assembly-enhancing protease n=1 Tax=Dongshaea marina TaxID=2047966 RepID=UPI003899211E